MSLREKIRKDIEEAISRWPLAIGEKEVGVARTSNQRFGDYSSNVAMVLAGKIRQSPMEFAKKLADSLENQAYIEKLEAREPGFINFFIKDETIHKEVEKLLKKDKFETEFTGKKVIVEFTDPNPFKEFHVGHLYSNSVGEAISRLLEAGGAEVKRANYQGDVGLHVAKCIWGIRKAQESQSKRLPDLARGPLRERIEFLGTAYATGAAAYDQDEKAKKEIIKLNKEIYEKLDKLEEYKLGKAWSLENFEQIYARLGTKFDLYYFESEVGVDGAKIVRDNFKKVFEQSDGAVIFPGEKYGLHSRVFINSLGLPTYEAKELGLAFKKYEDFAHDLSIIVTGSEIVDYFKVLVKAIELIDKKLAAKVRHIAHGMVRMPGGKISSRLGNVISATSLLDEAKQRALALSKDSAKGKGQTLAKDDSSQRSGLNLEAKQIAEQVAVGAVKYAMLRGNVGQDIKFSFDEAMSLEGNSGPYLQYTHARCRSVLKKGKVKSVKGKVDFSGSASEEKLLLATLGHFEEAMVDATQAFVPNTLANYLFELAQKYNTFYNNLRIIDAKEAERARRLFLTDTTAKILKKGLNLLGISAPEKM